MTRAAASNPCNLINEAGRLMKDRLEEIYKANARYVYNVALGILRNRSDAEDVMQAVFTKLMGSLHTFRGEADIRTFLYRMAVNRSIDMIRFNRRLEEKAEKAAPATRALPGHDKPSFADLVSPLDEDHRTVLLLAEVGGFKYAEIAKMLGIEIGTVKSRVNRAVTKLREIYAAEGKL